MLDEKDLQAIGQLMDAKLEKQKEELTQTMDARMDEKIRDSESRMMAFFEAAIMPKFDLLADGLAAVNQRLDDMPTKDDLVPLTLRIEALEAMVRRHSKEIAELKKAQ